MWARMLGNGKCQQYGVWAGLELMCTWCPAGVVCDLPIRECNSELDMYPCCRYALTVGGVVRVRSPCWSPLFVHIYLLLSLLLLLYFDGSLR